MKQFTNEEIQKSIEMIRTILMNDMQWVDMIYNGDKDTLRESYELVIESEEGIRNASFDKDLFEKVHRHCRPSQTYLHLPLTCDTLFPISPGIFWKLNLNSLYYMLTWSLRLR